MKIQRIPHQGYSKLHPGMNSFVWNLRYPDAKADTSATFEASPLGPKVIPGNYKVKMLIGDSLIMEQSFHVEKDPRSNTTQSDFQEQFDLNATHCKRVE